MGLSTSQKSDTVEFWALLSLATVGFIAFTLFQYSTPAAFVSIRGENIRGMFLFSRHLGIPHFALGAEGYALSFRFFLVLLVGLNICTSTAALRIDPKHQYSLLVLVGMLCIFVSVIFPPVESVDTFNYVALGKLYAVYRLNPYTNSSYVLYLHHDPIVHYLQLVFASFYGPLWTLIQSAIVALMRGPNLFIQIIAFKLLEGLSLVVAADAARRYCKPRDPRYATAALIAVGLNPLCLVEGPGNGHNDIFMMALVLIGLCLYDRAKHKEAGFTFGLATAIKFVPLSMVPFLVVSEITNLKRASWQSSATCFLLLLLPTALLAVPFWDGGAAIRALQDRSQGNTEVPMDYAISSGHPSVPPPPRQRSAGMVIKQWRLFLLYFSLAGLLAFRRKLLQIQEVRSSVHFLLGTSGYPAWLVVWILFASLVPVLIQGYWFSWYSTWAIVSAACIWTTRGSPLWVWTMTIALSDSLHYTF